VAQVYEGDNQVFNRLQRRIDATERTYHRTLAALQKIESRAPQPDDPILQAPDPRPPAPGPASEASHPPPLLCCLHEQKSPHCHG
jgi:uncharacterized protein involved in exopolysaccharide biosynthesis